MPYSVLLDLFGMSSLVLLRTTLASSFTSMPWVDGEDRTIRTSQLSNLRKTNAMQSIGWFAKHLTQGACQHNSFNIREMLLLGSRAITSVMPQKRTPSS